LRIHRFSYRSFCATVRQIVENAEKRNFSN
jgi:hypothetical protein